MRAKEFPYDDMYGYVGDIATKLSTFKLRILMGAREETLRMSVFFFLHFTPYNSYLTILTQIF
jgi:hypothetical protein